MPADGLSTRDRAGRLDKAGLRPDVEGFLRKHVNTWANKMAIPLLTLRKRERRKKKAPGRRPNTPEGKRIR